MTFYTTVRQKQTNYSDTISTYFLRTIIWNTACEREECWLADVCPDVRTLFPCWISRNTSSAFSMCSSFSPTTFTCPLWSSSTRSFNFLLSKSNTCQTQCHENYLVYVFSKKIFNCFLMFNKFHNSSISKILSKSVLNINSIYIKLLHSKFKLPTQAGKCRVNSWELKFESSNSIRWTRMTWHYISFIVKGNLIFNLEKVHHKAMYQLFIKLYYEQELHKVEHIP